MKPARAEGHARTARRLRIEPTRAAPEVALVDELDTLCVSCRRRARWDPNLRLEQLCDRCWRLMAPRLVEESETLL